MAGCASGSCQVPLTNRNDKRKEFETDPRNARETCQGLRDDLFGIAQRYFDVAPDLVRIEENLHDAWDELIHAAKILPAGDAEHDRLITLVHEVRELGDSVRTTQDDVATLSNGKRLWTDLPFLADEIFDSWIKESAVFTSAERASLAVLSSKLCATGICAPEMARCALWLFREALETEKPGAHIINMLPACLEWLRHSNIKIVKWCAENSAPLSHKEDKIVTSPGPLAAGINVLGEGFSVARWLFWRQRLGELYTHGNGDMARLSRACFEQMINTGSLVGIDIPGEKRYLANIFKALDAELASRGFKGSVGAEDIEIDPSWVAEDLADRQMVE
ncbi:hypothetical protein QQS21_004788 [Conoideocrella luteorostrata]|uniref:Uncharacterized protein n=1 Tax=Conoideocrella luteorostrata TaxID=1105319 RepID=A0AAJ0CQM4_9HYPO|nr:hypothetical protein QQS21_004788 [Conoideocrella luteorostrata]